MSASLEVEIERWPLREAFTISRGSKNEALVVIARIRDGEHVGRGEAVPYARYGEEPAGVEAAIRSIAPRIEAGLTREALRSLLPAGAARNAVDLALFELESAKLGVGVAERAGLTPRRVLSAITIPIRDLDETRAIARREAGQALLKIKLGGRDDVARVRAVRDEAPGARLIVDANEGWDLETLERAAPELAALGVELIEQPLPAADDAALEGFESPVMLCADESFHGEPRELDALRARYGAVNVKLDKQGGLTSALEAVARAEELGFDVMVGTMVATSLAVAPAVLLATRARWADLDAALFLVRDRTPGLRYEGATFVEPPPHDLWG